MSPTSLASMAFAGFALLAATQSLAQDATIGCSSVELIVGFGAGGGTDLFARSIQPRIEEELGVPVQVLNITGGSGVVAFRDVMRRPADGCTIFGINTDYVLLEVTGAAAELSLLDMSPLVRAHVDIGLLNASASGAESFEAMVMTARNEGRDLLIGGVGAGSFDEGAVMILMDQSDIGYRFIPYDGAQEMHADLLGGRLDLAYDEVGVMLPMAEAGQVRPLLVAFDERIDSLPEVPTAGELGLNVSPPIWRGVAVRRETPEDIKQAIASAVEAALSDERYRAYEIGRSLDIVPGFAGPDAFPDIVRLEIENFAASLGN
ncbi:MAG: tripartite tricarboxylate transporter substrate binding protein [Rhizobiales bacterium]|nr:tripartite tricarboxylate transporter substrate binding protein [Hyphomicrobiales bacterium]MBO6699020.1 tripartite tricarboxylate transporter substrate binding protein [Hyphomicrobiales bacterium]MBO6734727.1 tripartite tricarboxylate transporter substrate binding protein [Hyphomicrobiales bacterium]MBO6911467.1 tripartite tricarboxylate transporter substrate binding protein [Hyphomicrobiales bacterium]MBO6957047.1 tripartite tricarboxylate transporter substrate binding protein [Hyphomicrob